MQFDTDNRGGEALLQQVITTLNRNLSDAVLQIVFQNAADRLSSEVVKSPINCASVLKFIVIADRQEDLDIASVTSLIGF